MPAASPPVLDGGAAARDVVRMCLTVPAELSSLPRVRGAVSMALERSRWNDGRPAEVLLAVSEAVGNAIEHGSRPGDPVEVDITVTAADARVRVADCGRPGARLPSDAPTAPPTASTRGRGRLIMQSLTDRLEAGPTGEGTEVVLHFSAG